MLKYRACVLMMLAYSHHIDTLDEQANGLALLGNQLHAHYCIVASNLHGLNSCWKRPTCRLHVSTEGWNFLSPPHCGPSVRQAVANMCSSGWSAWKTHEHGVDLSRSHTDSDETLSCKTNIKFLFAH